MPSDQNDATYVVHCPPGSPHVAIVNPPDGQFRSVSSATAQGGTAAIGDCTDAAVYLVVTGPLGRIRSLASTGYVLTVDQAAGLIVDLEQAAKAALSLN